jgi:thiol-disulfide isomerase/thioredoxin
MTSKQVFVILLLWAISGLFFFNIVEISLPDDSVRPDSYMPGVYELDPDNWQHLILDRGEKPALVAFYSQDCIFCHEFAKVWAEVGKWYLNHADILVGKIDASKYRQFAKEKRVKSLPTITLVLKHYKTYKNKTDTEVDDKKRFFIEHFKELNLDAITKFVEDVLFTKDEDINEKDEL